jgi:hypothetical protein
MVAISNLLRDLNERCASVGSACRFDVELLHERARLSGLTPGGAESYNRTCRLLKARDGWLAVNLARERDRECLPALLGRGRGCGCYCGYSRRRWTFDRCEPVHQRELRSEHELMGE